MQTAHTGTRAFVAGARAISPLLLGVIPFGLILGATAAVGTVGAALGWSTSWIIFGGAAQFVTIGLLDGGAAAAVVIATALVVQSRHFLYSAAMAPHFRSFGPGWRFTLPYLLTDQAFAVSIVAYGDFDDPTVKRWFYIGAATTLWVVWQITTLIGALLGAEVPESWSLDFAIPLVFLALLMPLLKNRPSLAAAVTGGVVSVVAWPAPYNLGLIIGALAGIVAGVLVERTTR